MPGAARRHRSLRTRLLVIACVASCTAWLSGGGAMYWAAAQEDDTLFDTRLQELAATVMRFSEHELLEMQGQQDPGMHADSQLTLGERYQYQIWRNGALMLRSASAQRETPLMPLGQSGFATLKGPRGPLRVFSMQGESPGMLIQVAERIDARDHVVASFGAYFFAFLVLSLGLVALLSFALLRVALRPAERVAAQLRQRGPADLGAVLEPDPPAELVPMIDAINQLLQRISQSMSAQRGFVATAAHELRSPLAGLRANAQVAGRARNDEERQQAYAALMQGVDRTSHLLDQLLDLARADMLAREPAFARASCVAVLLHDAMQVVLADVAGDLQAHQVTVQALFKAPTLHGVPAAVEMLLRNLVRNAIVHSPAGAPVYVGSAWGRNGSVVLTVDDAGGGIAPAERLRVFEPFYRAPGQQVAGVGLGLAIVHAVAQVHGARIQLLDAARGGLQVRVEFPAAPAQGADGPRSQRPDAPPLSDAA